MALNYFFESLKIQEKIDVKRRIGIIYVKIGNLYMYKGDYEKAAKYLEKSLILIHKEFGMKDIKLETITNLYLTYKNLGKEYDINEIHSLIKDADNVEFEVNLRLYELLEESSYLKTAHNQVQDKVSAMEKELAEKFLNYNIPKAIVEEWEKVSKVKN